VPQQMRLYSRKRSYAPNLTVRVSSSWSSTSAIDVRMRTGTFCTFTLKGDDQQCRMSLAGNADRGCRVCLFFSTQQVAIVPPPAQIHISIRSESHAVHGLLLPVTPSFTASLGPALSAAQFPALS